jgi:hypothetical protein
MGCLTKQLIHPIVTCYRVSRVFGHFAGQDSPIPRSESSDLPLTLLIDSMMPATQSSRFRSKAETAVATLSFTQLRASSLLFADGNQEVF